MGKSKKSGDTYLFTSESVSMGHPDKVSDQISDAVLDSILKHDPRARVACETLVTTGLICLAGEVTVHNPKAELALHNAEQTAREVVRKIGYDDPAGGFDYRSCAVVRTLHSQSPDINQGVDRSKEDEQGAGDQGLMFGFACRETRALMPLPIQISHRLVERQAKVRQEGVLAWLRPDAKSQVTIAYDGDKPVRLDAVVLSTQHADDGKLLDKNGNVNDKFRKAIIDKIIKPVVMDEAPHLWSNKIKFHINPTGRFIVGGPHGDAGLTGRKIIVDTYGGRGRHGGGAFSGKDPSKVDRSAAYMARYIAKNIVAAKLADICEVQLSYAIGVAEPTSVHVDTQGTGRIPGDVMSKLIRDHFALTPAGLIRQLNLLRPIYFETARHGHFGRTGANFTWEKTDKAAELRKAAEKWIA